MTAAGVATIPAAPTIVMLAVDDLDIGLDFRLDEDPDDLADLAASIAELGVLQPLTVRQTDAGWEVVAGRRRLAAARQAGLMSVPCTLRTLTADEAADVALAENLHRRDLSAVEVALALARLRDQGLNQTQIAERVGRSQGTVSALLRLLDIPAHLRDRVHRREIGYRTALDLTRRRSYTKKAPGTKGTPPPGRRRRRHRRHLLAAPPRPADRRDHLHPPPPTRQRPRSLRTPAGAPRARQRARRRHPCTRRTGGLS